MNANGVLRTRAIFLLALLLVLSGCATTQKLSDEDRTKIRTVRINSAVQKVPSMYYLAPGPAILFGFGAIGPVAAAAGSIAPAKALQDFAEQKGIFIEKIAFEEIDAALRRSGRLKVSNSGEPTDAVINVIVGQYGFTVPHGFSSRVGPVIAIRCVMVDAAGKVLGSAYDFVVRSPVETMTPEELRDDPRRIESAWRAAAKLVAANIAKDFGYGDSTSQRAVATHAPPTASAAAPAAPAALAMAPTRTVAASAGLPAAGTSWTYAFQDRLFTRRRTDFTVRVQRVDDHVVEETMSVRSQTDQGFQRSVDAREKRFLEYVLGSGALLVELAPYLLAAGGDKAPADNLSATGYPIGSAGWPGWVLKVQVRGWEQVTVPAGTLRALHVQVNGEREWIPVTSEPHAGHFRMSVWYAADTQRYVKLHHQMWQGLASRPGRQLGDDSVELLKYVPAP